MKNKWKKWLCLGIASCMLASGMTGTLAYAAPSEERGQTESMEESGQQAAGTENENTELTNLALLAEADSTCSDGAYPDSKINDGSYDKEDGIVSKKGVTFPTYETLVWESPQTFDSVNMVAWWCQSQAPKNWDIEVSENGVDGWTKVASSGDVEWEESSTRIENKMVTFDPVENVKGMRVVINSAYLEWENKFAYLEIEVFNSQEKPGEKTLYSMDIKQKPDKLQYRTGEELDLTGMEVEVTYSDTTTAPVTDYKVDGYDKNTVGRQQITVSYTENNKTVEAAFFVTVLAEDDSNLYPVLDDLDPDQWVYQFGDEFDETELSDMWEPSYFEYWAHSSVTPNSVFEIRDGVLSEIVNADSPYYDATTDPGFRNPGMSLGVRDYVHMYRDNLVQYRHMPTDDRYVTKYGYYELRAKLNNKDGSSAAWWMTGFHDTETDTAEIDIIEYAGDVVNGKNKIGGWMYNWSDPKLTSATDSPVLVDFDPSADYHVYGLEWQPDYLKFYVDGKLMSTINQSPDYRMITWLSYNHHDSRTNDTFPKSWGIDYFRVWQDKDILEAEEAENASKEAETAATGNLALDAYASTVGISASHYKQSAPLKMNDGSDETVYRTPDSTSYPYYLYLDWTEPQTVNSLTLKAQKDQAPTSYDIEYSEDGRYGWRPVVQNIRPEWQESDGTVEAHTTYFETLENVKYIRVKVNEANTTPGYFAVNELEAGYQEGVDAEKAPESYIYNLAPYAEVISSGHDNSFPVGDVADEVYLNEFRSSGVTEFPYYITFNWDEVQTFSQIKMTCNNCLSAAPYDFEVQVSADGETGWETVAEVSDAKWESDNQYETKTIEFPEVTDKKGCRIKINGANMNNGYFKAAEIEIGQLVENKEEVTLESISLKEPEKKEYKMGEALDLSGMEVTANYSDGSSRVLQAGEYEISGFDSSTAGEKTITVTYEGITAAFKVTVKADENNGGQDKPDKPGTGDPDQDKPDGSNNTTDKGGDKTSDKTGNTTVQTGDDTKGVFFLLSVCVISLGAAGVACRKLRRR